MDVRKRLRQLMDERGWTMYRVAKEADIPLSTIQNMFRRNTDPSIWTLEAICSSMGITLSRFFDDESETDFAKEQRELFQGWNRLSEHEKQLISELVTMLGKKTHP